MSRHKSYREESRANWGTKSDRALNIEQIQTGAILRIADAVEKVAKDRIALENSLKYQMIRGDRLLSELETERRRSAALRGHLKRLKARGESCDQ